MPKKTVLFVITKSNWGGAQRYVYDLATNLPEGYTPVVALGGTGVLAEKLKERHIQTVHLKSLERDIKIFKDIAATIELYKLIRKMRPDIVHLNSSKTGALGALAARLAGVRRIVFTVHGWAFNEPVPWATRSFRWFASLVTLLLCHRTITVSHFASLQAPIDINIRTVHNGIEPPTFLSRYEARAEIAARAHIPTDAFIFGTISELHLNKGVDILIQATYLVDNVYVVIIGEGEEREALEKLITDLDLTDRVKLIGFVDNAARLLKAFDVFVLSSRTEALGYVLIEAGMAEVPVIASAVGGIPELITDQITGDLVHAFNDELLAESMREFFESPNTRVQYADALKAHVTRNFNLTDMVQKTIEVYEP
jgi:glycosyltransferase involved in cell wall biosynthesis